MLHEASRIIGLSVYTRRGAHLGTVHDVRLDTTTRRIDSLYISGTEPRLVPNSANIIVPYRWVQDLDAVVGLRHFPGPRQFGETVEVADAEMEFEE